MKRFTSGLVAITWCVLQGLSIVSQAASPLQSRIFIDNVWAGTRVGFDALRVGDKAYVGYYDASRYLTVAEADLRTGAVRTIRLASQFAGWDSHNYIALDYDSAGILHVSGNEHATPLLYARTNRSNDLTSLTLINRMNGNREQRVTYPKFLNDDRGDTLFIYRDGGSGDGNYVIKRFVDGAWKDMLSSPLFGDKGVAGTVSAYPTQFQARRNGGYCVAWVWRRTPDVRTNSDIAYACSADMKVWTRFDGVALRLPINQGDGAEVVDVPENTGLFNNIELGRNEQGDPVISFLKYDDKGFTQLFHAVLMNGRWIVKSVTQWDYRWDFGGTHSIESEISFSGLRTDSGRSIETITHRKYGTKRYLFDARGLDVVEIADETPLAATTAVDIVKPLKRNAMRVRGPGVGRFAIIWGTYPPDNHDEPRRCGDQEDKCVLSSKLFLIQLEGN
ncbi:BNR repeat-containing protein [Paraburkholderia sp. J94]|uniref:BNR repeat-containing protein n=1 Tax=Paraburkholderia sp. J94 TaxID=2805441 RepID=UPI002AB1D0C0|nr:BNR repeat-containing protein [Paraburkholderia sp. J94]